MDDEELGKWSWSNVKNQTPESIKDWFVLTAGFVLGCFGFNPEMWQVTAGAGVLLVTLNVFYVRPKRKAQDEVLSLKGIDFGKQLAATDATERPLRGK